MNSKICSLQEIADVQLGVKTFLNPFFYVTDEIVSRFGIEQEFLTPVFRTRDADKEKFLQDSKNTQHKIFLCSTDVSKLKGTGAARYIKWGSTQRYKTGNKGLWRETSAVKPNERNWYENQALPPPSRIALLKASDDYLAPLIIDKRIQLDQRFNQLRPKPGVSEEVLIGLLCSGWFAMTLETYGATSMGQGALEMATQPLRKLPVPDLRSLSKNLEKRMISATKELLKGKRLPVQKIESSPAQNELDLLILEVLEIPSSRLPEVYREINRMRKVRKDLATGKAKIKREKYQEDISEVAKEVASRVSLDLAGKLFPRDYLKKGSARIQAELGNVAGALHASRILNQHHIRVTTDQGEVVYEDTFETPIGDLFIRAVQAGQRRFEVPQDPEEAAIALQQFEDALTLSKETLDDAASGLSKSVQASLVTLVEEELNLPLNDLFGPLKGETFLQID